MSHQAGGQESQPGYMDGVCVKISEKYKPPPRINLAISYSQRLSVNNQTQDSKQLYNFTLEKKVKDCIKDLKSMRKTMKDNKRDKLEKIKAARKEQLEAVAIESSGNDCEVESSSVTCSEAVTTDIFYPTFSNILTPTPLGTNNACNYKSPADKTPFNIADFEADTSSPFDNMELKTINDIEELAQVLKKDYTNPTTNEPNNWTGPTPFTTYNIPQTSSTSACPPITTYYNKFNGFYYSPSQNYTTSIEPNKSDSLEKLSQSNINQINETLQNIHIANTLENLKEVSKKERDEIFELLPENLQRLSQNISSMGFPLSRVARVCQALGDDQKKVVEHLLVMSELLDLGFTEKDVSSALIRCNNDRDKALDILIT